MAMGVLKVRYGSYSIQGSASFDRMLVEVGCSTYDLFTNKGFQGIPVKGDVLGLVDRVVARALRADSGVVRIHVEAHQISVIFSTAVSQHDIESFLPNVMLAAAGGLKMKVEVVQG